MNKVVAAIPLVALALAGCSSSSAGSHAGGSTGPKVTTAPSPPSQLGRGDFTFQAASGAAGNVSIPGKVDSELETLRGLAGDAEQVVYLTAHVDNRSGSRLFGLSSIEIFTPDGNKLTYQPAADYVDGLRRSLPSSAPVADYNRFIDYSNTHDSVAGVGEAIDVVLVGPALPETVARVALYLDGIGSESVDPSTTIEAVYPRAARRQRADVVGRGVTHVLRFYGDGHEGPSWRCSCGAVGQDASREEAAWSAQSHLNEVFASADDEV